MTARRSVSCAPTRRCATRRSATSISSRSPPRRARPVCRVLDYSKYKYEQSQKQKAARKHQQQITIREIKFRPKIAEQDYATKKRHVERFLKHKDKVKITIMFRGREVTHPERGQMILDRLAEELTELADHRAAPQPRRAQHDDAAGPVQGGPQPGRWARTARTAPSRRPRPTPGAPVATPRPSRRGDEAEPAADGADAEPWRPTTPSPWRRRRPSRRRERRRRARGLAPRARHVLEVRDRVAHGRRRRRACAARRRTRAPWRSASRPRGRA